MPLTLHPTSSVKVCQNTRLKKYHKWNIPTKVCLKDLFQVVDPSKSATIDQYLFEHLHQHLRRHSMCFLMQTSYQSKLDKFTARQKFPKKEDEIDRYYPVGKDSRIYPRHPVPASRKIVEKRADQII